LFILVPANWAIFRALDRVEWAWVAVPFLAIAGTIAVVRLAQLDIGFARSRVELSVVETQPEFSRGHVTRFVGLYTALSTNYELLFADESAIALPFAMDEQRSRAQWDQPDIFLQRLDKKDAKVQLDGFAVSSNTTGMLHCEQMLDLGGAIRLVERGPRQLEVENDTDYGLRDVGIVRRRDDRLEVAWIGDLRAKSALSITFRPASDRASVRRAWQQFGNRANDATRGIDLQPFLELALNPTRFHKGDAKLIGWTDHELKSLSIRPDTTQRVFRSVVVANLKYGKLPKPRSDANAPAPSDIPDETNDD
jgi:hypothetical protein